MIGSLGNIVESVRNLEVSSIEIVSESDHLESTLTLRMASTGYPVP